MKKTFYRYYWGNGKDAVGRYRLKFKGRICRVLCRLKLNSCVIEFIDNGEKLCISRNALRKVN
ncbi:MAG: hypothetical protein ACETVZ_00280 [Phycisphaerae bacterium]